MTITFITTKPPTLNSGAEVRNYYLLKALENDKEVDIINLLFFSIDGQNFKNSFSSKVSLHFFPLEKRNRLESISNYLNGKIPYVENLKKNKYIDQTKKIIDSSDLVILSELDGYFSVSKLYDEGFIFPPSILDAHNVEYIRFKSEIEFSSLLKKNLAKHLISKLKDEEIIAAKRVTTVITCSIDDKKYFSNLLNKEKILVIPNGTVPQKKKSHNKNDNLLFMGVLSYPPNSDALKYFFSEIFPPLRKLKPELKVTILGKNPESWLMKLASENSSVDLKGFVPSVSDYVSNASICICPLRFGSGTRLKILEYMSYAKPIVSSSVGCEGIDVIDGKNVLIADDAKSFIEKIISLLDNKTLRDHIGSEAHKLVKEKYNWNDLGSQFITHVNRMVKK